MSPKSSKHSKLIFALSTVSLLTSCATVPTSPTTNVNSAYTQTMPIIDRTGRIAYVEEVSTVKGKISSLYTITPDGSDRQLLAQIQGLIFSPAWSFDGKKLAYAVQLPKSHPRIFVHDIATRKVQQVATPKGASLSPSFSPDGRYLLFSASQNGNADIYRKSLVDGTTERLTTLKSTEVQPSYAPDGHSFVYVSDKARSGRAEVYRYTFATGQARKLKSGYSASPEVSRDGQKMGFLNGSQASVMTLATGNVTNLANTGLDEPARLSPSGRYAVYPIGSKMGDGSMVIRSLDSGVSYTISSKTGGRMRSPVWGVGSDD